MLPVLIIDDDPDIRSALETLLQIHDIPTRSADGPEAALALLGREAVGAVLQDMNFARDTTSGREGVALFRRIRELEPQLPVILLTAWASLETAVQLVKEGAEDYVQKPWDDDKLLQKVRRLLDRRAQRAAAPAPAAHTAAEEARRAGLVYESRAMDAVVRLALSAARSDAPVLITGPNGAGKERLAELVVKRSARLDRPFVRVNAAALPEQLLEAELFGAEPGAFTGALKRRQGRFEEAQGGSLFLDEIGCLSPAGQAKLLRVLSSGEFQRLGSNQTLRADARILSATNADLRAAIRQGAFREDLFFRLAVIELAIPPLRERPEDVLPLCEHFLRGLGEGRPLAPAARAALLAHGWPGNARELENRARRAAAIGEGDALEAADFGLGEGSAAGEAQGAPVEGRAAAGDEPERAAIEAALLAAEGNVSRAAAAMGVSRQALYRRMERLGISMVRRPRS